MDNVHANHRPNNHSALSYKGQSESHNLQLRLQQPTSTRREAAAMETPITKGIFFPPDAQGRIVLGADKLRAAAGRAPKTNTVNYHMIGKSSAPARVDVLVKTLKTAVQFAILKYYLEANGTKPKGFASFYTGSPLHPRI